MEEEISLREIIDTLWKGKLLIGVITAIVVLAGVIYSFFIASPIYRGEAQVTVHNVASVPESVQPYIDEMTSPDVFGQAIKSPSTIGELIQKENLDMSVNLLKDKINIELPTEETGPYIDISMEASDRDMIKSIMDGLLTITREQIEGNIQNRLDLLKNEYSNKMAEEETKLEVAVDQFNQLASDYDLPTIILFQQNASNSQYVVEVNDAILDQLKALDKADQVKYEQLNRKIDEIKELYNFYSSKYEDVESISTMNIMDLSTNVLSEPFVTTNPISPNKKLNVAIAFVLGLMVSVGIVFLREYLQNTPSTNK